jgi:hypothetical protein
LLPPELLVLPPELLVLPPLLGVPPPPLQSHVEQLVGTHVPHEDAL